MNFEDKLKMFNVDKNKDIPATRPRNKTYNNPQNKNLQNNIINNPSSSVSNQIKKDVASNIISQDESYDNKLKMFQTSSNKNDIPIRAKPRTKTEPPKHKTNEQTVGNAGYVKSGYLDSMTLTEDRNTDVKLTENAFKNRQNMFSQTNKNSQTGQNFIFKDDKNKTDTIENSTYVKSTKQDSMSLTGDKNQEIKLSGNAFKDRMIMFKDNNANQISYIKKNAEEILKKNEKNNNNVPNENYVKSGYVDSMSLTEDKNTDIKLSEDTFKNRKNVFSDNKKTNEENKTFVFKDDANHNEENDNKNYVKSTKQDSMSLTGMKNQEIKLTGNAFKERQNMFTGINNDKNPIKTFVFKDDKNKTDTIENSTYVKSTKQDSMSLTGDKNQEIKLSGNAFKDRMIMFTEKPKEPPFIKKKTNEKILSDSNSMDDKNPDIKIEVFKNFEEIYDKFQIPINKKKLPKKKIFDF